MSALGITEAKKHLNLGSSAPSAALPDDELQAMIDTAEAVLTRLVGPLAPTTYTEYVTPTAAGTLLLRRTPVLSVTSVTPYGGTAVDITSGLDVTGGMVRYLNGASRFNPATAPYVVVYQAGRSPVPPDLMFAVKELVRHLVATQRGSGRRPGPAAADVANTVPGADKALPIRVEQLIAPHRRPGFA